MALIEFENMSCSCGSALFVQGYALLHKPGAGMVNKFIGWHCAACGLAFDGLQAVQRREIDRRRKELEDIIAQQEALNG